MGEHFCPICAERHGAEEIVPVTELVDIDKPEGEDPEVAVAAIEAVAEVAEAALATVTELHAQEEETERLEITEDAATDRTEVLADVLADIEEEPGEPALDEEPKRTRSSKAPRRRASPSPLPLLPEKKAAKVARRP